MINLLLINCYVKRQEERIRNFLDILSSLGYGVYVTGDVRIPTVENFDGIIISGSEKNVSKGEYSEELAELINKTYLPVLAICYGFHLLARVCGCQVLRGGRVKGEVEVTILKEDEIFWDLGKRVKVNMNHADYVKYEEMLFESGLELLATSETSKVEAFKSNERPHYGVQFHPERSGNVGRKIFENFGKYVVKK